jgi:Rod binding domain-containing protein
MTQPSLALASPATSVRPVPSAAVTARAKAEQFEQMFIHSMLEQLYADMPVNEITGGGHAESQWRGLLLDEYAKSMTQRGGIGIADSVYADLLRLQESSQR